MTSVSVQSSVKQAKLVVTTESHRMSHYSLLESESVIIGSGGNSGLKLDDQAISSIHCILRLSDGQLFVQDWCSNLGTLVNGVRIEEETAVPDGSRIGIGRFEIQVELDCGAGGRARETENAEHAAVEATETASVPQRDDADALTASTSGVEPDVVMSDANAEADELESSGDEPLPPSAVASVAIHDPSSSGTEDARRPRRLLLEGIDPEALNLLQAEIECLQSDLLERDRQLAELQSLVDCQADGEPELNASESEALVTRLEQLLEELDCSDQRVRVAEELLQAEQEVTRTQEEERAQIEAWLGDIERRISAREGEWHAERESLLRRVERLKAERDAADNQLASTDNSPDRVALQKNIVTELRQRVDELQDTLVKEERRRQALENELQEVKSKSPEEARQEYLETALREDRLKLAQEQAALSRERAQLARRLAEHQPVAPQEQHNEADERFRAFRQTLKELHSKDQVSSPGVRKASLGTRIAELWRKLDGPTDTD